ncbi:MAG: hypothetical protein U1E76_11270 [Planctomycetota bacterium]
MKAFAPYLFVAVSSASLALAQQPAADEITKDGVVTGTVQITFGTRSDVDKDGNPNKGAQDVYKFDLKALDVTTITGSVYRRPRIKSWGLTQQDAGLRFDLNYSTINKDKPTDPPKLTAKLGGVVPLDVSKGTYILDGNKDSPLRLDASAVKAGAVDNFRGIIQGKSPDKKSLKEMVLKFTTGGTGKSFTVKKADPLYFNGITLAAGPYGYLLQTTVNGALVYNYDSGSYLTNDLTFVSSGGGKDETDRVQGTIAWIKDKDYASNGKSYYDFNLKFNEDKLGKKTDESAVFAAADDESAIFAVDNSVPSLTGRVAYEDQGDRVDDEGETVIIPKTSKVTYQLNANKLTKRQIHNFLKLWILISGPTNDE